MRGFGTPDAEPILRATPAALHRENFPAGTVVTPGGDYGSPNDLKPPN